MNSSPDERPEWFCLRSQTKREHIAAGHLRELEGVEVFCPRLRYRKATRRGKIWWMEPMFPGYILAKFVLSEKERPVTFCNGVRGLVRFGSHTPPVPDDFVEAIKRNIQASTTAEDSEIITYTPSIEPGDGVEIAHGPFQGMQGTVVAVPSAMDRVKVLLEFLGKTQPVEVDLFSLILPKQPLVNLALNP